MLITIIGLLAAALTSLSYIPRVKKSLPAGSTKDLSQKKSCGPCSWTCRVNRVWLPKGDFVIIVANAVGLALVATLIRFKIRDAG
jgi:MtN3 and saliva related transmembrane protein